MGNPNKETEMFNKYNLPESFWDGFMFALLMVFMSFVLGMFIYGMYKLLT